MPSGFDPSNSALMLATASVRCRTGREGSAIHDAGCRAPKRAASGVELLRVGRFADFALWLADRRRVQETEDFIFTTVSPLMNLVGALWAEGRLSVADEHFASMQIKSCCSTALICEAPCSSALSSPRHRRVKRMKSARFAPQSSPGKLAGTCYTWPKSLGHGDRACGRAPWRPMRLSQQYLLAYRAFEKILAACM